MGNLLATLVNSASAMRVYDRALSVVQNNVSNASTPGWARQTQALVAQPFNPELGILGGVTVGDLVDGRNEFSERSVREQQQQHGYAAERAQALAALEPVLGVGNSGLSAGLNNFFESISQWSVNPNDNGARQVMLERAGAVALRFNETSNNLVAASHQIDSQIQSTVAGINRLAAQLQGLNQQRRQAFRDTPDAGVAAQLYSTLEELSQYVDYTALPQLDGSVTVFLGGQVPLVIGDHVYPVSEDTSLLDRTSLLDADGEDVTGTLSGGRLKALFEVRNGVLADLRSDLDLLALSFADDVNFVLSQGVDVNWSAPTHDLFHYDDAGPASSLSVTDITASELAGAVPTALGGNDNILSLMQLADTQQVNGMTFTQFYAQMAARVGRESAAARDDTEVRQELLSQAQSLRQELSGVSLDEEAVRLIELQRGYEANAKLLTTLNDMTEVLMSIMR